MNLRTPWQFHSIALISCVSLTWLAYFGNTDHQLLHWDDITYVSSNPWVIQPSWMHIQEIFTQSRLLNWHPITWLSFIPEYYLCESVASCYKTTNITLHGINSFLVYYLTWLILAVVKPALERKQLAIASLLSGLLFALHPLHAESTIWVAERKDLLCALFYFAAIIFYLRIHFLKLSDATFLPLLMFTLAFMSKSMAVSLPLVLLMLDLLIPSRLVYLSSKNTFFVLFVEKIPIYAAAATVGVITIWSQGVANTDTPVTSDPITVVVASISHYVFALIYPVGLSPLYPAELLATGLTSKEYFIFGLCVMIFLWCLQKEFKLALLFIGYFIVTILPVVGIVKIGAHAYADRYTYIPMMGFFIIGGYLFSLLFQEFGRGIYGVVALTLSFLLYNTHGYKNVWRDDVTVWQYIADIYPDMSPVVHNNLGNSYFERGDLQQAEEQYRKILSIDKHTLNTYFNLAAVYQKQGNLAKSLTILEQGVKNNPDAPWMYIRAGDAHLDHNQLEKAIYFYTKSLEVEPNYYFGLQRIGKVMLINGQYTKAIELLRLVPIQKDIEFETKILLVQAYAHKDKRKALILLREIKSNFGNHPMIDKVRIILQAKEAL